MKKNTKFHSYLRCKAKLKSTPIFHFFDVKMFVLVCKRISQNVCSLFYCFLFYFLSVNTRFNAITTANSLSSLLNSYKTLKEGEEKKERGGGGERTELGVQCTVQDECTGDAFFAWVTLVAGIQHHSHSLTHTHTQSAVAKKCERNRGV